MEEIDTWQNTKIFNTTIREGVAIQEAQALKCSVLYHAPKSKPCIDYTNFTKELLKEIESHG